MKLDDKKEKIIDAKFEGEGCAISQSIASMLTEELKDLNIKDLKDLISQESIVELLGSEISPARMKCAMLSSECLKKVGL